MKKERKEKKKAGKGGRKRDRGGLHVDSVEERADKLLLC